MLERGFSETDLRLMLQDAFDWSSDKEPGRFVVHTRWEGRAWEIIVEPDLPDRRLVVITAFRLK